MDRHENLLLRFKFVKDAAYSHFDNHLLATMYIYFVALLVVICCYLSCMHIYS